MGYSITQSDDICLRKERNDHGRLEQILQIKLSQMNITLDLVKVKVH